MREKVAWAARETDVIRQIDASGKIDSETVTLFQDRFWAYLSATRMVWFYLGRLCDDWRLERGSAQQLLDTWLAARAGDARRTVTILEALRTQDVHVEPVDVGPQTTDVPAQSSDGLGVVGDLLARFRVPAIRLCVDYDGRPLQCAPLAVEGVQVLRELVEHLEDLMAPATKPDFTVTPRPRREGL